MTVFLIMFFEMSSFLEYERLSSDSGEVKKLEHYKSTKGLVWHPRKNGTFALLQCELFGKTWYGLPGGQPEADEDKNLTQTFMREVCEEVGAIISRKSTTVTARLRNTSKKVEWLIFEAQARGKIKDTSLTNSEKARNMQTQWVTPEKALQLLRDCKPPESKSMSVARDILILEQHLKRQ